ncbi:MAG TPA: hypothetical protein VHE30_25340 [Polyangiaceae bacterium]|nr:hypothetical protein [Polyangiaceae bacterium]
MLRRFGSAVLEISQHANAAKELSLGVVSALAFLLVGKESPRAS